jgi:hypothetical protein
MRWLSEFESFESTVAAINKALSASLIDIYDIVLACAGSPTTLPQKSKGGAGVGANCHCGGDANSNRLKAPLKLSIRHFQRVV